METRRGDETSRDSHLLQELLAALELAIERGEELGVSLRVAEEGLDVLLGERRWRVEEGDCPFRAYRCVYLARLDLVESRQRHVA